MPDPNEMVETYEEPTSSTTEVTPAVEGEGQIEQPAGESQPTSQEQYAPIAALQSEREKARLAEERAEFYRQMALANQQTQTQQPAVQAKPEPQFDPEEFVTYGTIEQQMNNRFQTVEERFKAIEVKGQIAEAKATHSDYEEVLQYADKLAAADPGLKAYILNSQNPPEVAYRIGRGSDEYIQKLIQQQSRTVVDKITTNLNQPQTLNNAPAASVKTAASKWENMPDEDFNAIVERTKAGYHG